MNVQKHKLVWARYVAGTPAKVPGRPWKSRDKRSYLPGLDRTGLRDLEGPVVPWSRD